MSPSRPHRKTSRSPTTCASRSTGQSHPTSRAQIFGRATDGWARVWRTPTRPHRTLPARDVRILPNALTADVATPWEALTTYAAGLRADDPLKKAFERLTFVHPDSALARYLHAGDPRDSAGEAQADPIFPFAANLSQRSVSGRFC